MFIRLSSSYYKALKTFVKGSKSNAQRTQKVLNLLSKNPKHPSLNLEKLIGSKIWTIRVDKGNRIFFYFIDQDTILLINIGKHDKYRKY